MENNHFFKFIWRANGLFIFLACVFSILGLFVSLLAFVDFSPEQEISFPLSSSSSEAQEEINQSHWFLMENHHFSVNEAVTFLLYTESESSNRIKLYKSSPMTIRNVLFVDKATLQEHWLFEHNKNEIEEARVLELFKGSVKTELGLLYVFIPNIDDISSEDGANHPKSIGFSRTHGHDFHEVKSGIESVIKASMLDDNRLFIVYLIDGNYFSLLFDLDKHQVLTDKPIRLVDTEYSRGTN